MVQSSKLGNISKVLKQELQKQKDGSTTCDSFTLKR